MFFYAIGTKQPLRIVDWLEIAGLPPEFLADSGRRGDLPGRRPGLGFRITIYFQRKGVTMAEIIARRVFQLAILALLLFGPGLVVPTTADPGNDNRAPDLGDCQDLEVPAGHKVKFSAYAEGVQIYRWNGTAWAFQAPEAVLYANDNANGVVGTHYAGPTWETNSGSYVVGAVMERCTPNPDAIPWLLLAAVDSDGPGVLDGVTYIQRVNTVGGLAPSEPGEFPGEVARVPYTADYYFYRQHKHK
jgi:hypothetical protein